MISSYVLLEDGRRFDGVSLGIEGPALGEVVFNTSMTGYQEILTDPSYTGQLVTMTYPLIGNYGTNDEDEESSGPQVAGFIVREAARVPSSWRSRSTLDAYLVKHGVVGIADVDTRALTRHIRTHGAMRGGIAPASLAQEALLEQVLAHPRMEGLDLACGVSTGKPYVVSPSGKEPRFHVVAFDFGVKANSPRMLAERGCRVTVVPADADTAAVLALEPDGLFISNGPGDPAAVEAAAETIREVAGRDVPVLGICLGHQLIARAYGGETFKLPFGHHGGNHPVRNHDQDTVEITSQNHGFAVRGDGPEVPGAPGLRVTHTNLYDDTVAGVAHKELPILSVQYHPEAAPGPHDSAYLFDQFVALMEERKD